MTTRDKKRLEQLMELFRPIPRVSEKTYEARFRAAPRKIIAYFSGMPEAGRRRLAPEIARLHKAALRELFEAEQTKDGPLDPHFTAVGLAATATLAELQRNGWWVSMVAFEALAARRPSWLAEAVELGLDQTSSSFSIGGVAHGINHLATQGLLPSAPETAALSRGTASSQ
jgi:hypothetical protein